MGCLVIRLRRDQGLCCGQEARPSPAPWDVHDSRHVPRHHPQTAGRGKGWPLLSARPDVAHLNAQTHHIPHQTSAAHGGFIDHQVTTAWDVHQHKQRSYTRHRAVSKDTAEAQKLQHSHAVSSTG